MEYNLSIAAIQGYTPTERAQAISRELWHICRPPSAWDKDESGYLFGWLTHPITGAAVLIAYLNYIIKVHPQKDLAALVALFPELSTQEKAQLAGYIAQSQQFPFAHIVPSNAVSFTNEQLEIDGWFEPLTPLP